MSHPEPSLRQQLIDARANVQRQIEVLRAGPASVGSAGAFIDNSGLIAELSTTLRELDEGLANLGAEDS